MGAARANAAGGNGLNREDGTTASGADANSVTRAGGGAYVIGRGFNHETGGFGGALKRSPYGPEVLK